MPKLTKICEHEWDRPIIYVTAIPILDYVEDAVPELYGK